MSEPRDAPSPVGPRPTSDGVLGGDMGLRLGNLGCRKRHRTDSSLGRRVEDPEFRRWGSSFLFVFLSFRFRRDSRRSPEEASQVWWSHRSPGLRGGAGGGARVSLDPGRLGTAPSAGGWGGRMPRGTRGAPPKSPSDSRLPYSCGACRFPRGSRSFGGGTGRSGGRSGRARPTFAVHGRAECVIYRGRSRRVAFPTSGHPGGPSASPRCVPEVTNRSVTIALCDWGEPGRRTRSGADGESSFAIYFGSSRWYSRLASADDDVPVRTVSSAAPSMNSSAIFSLGGLCI